jgi:biopolymer transport protein ExbD
MYRRPKKKLLGQDAIPTTSLADMMFLLLIFFIMTTTLSRVTGFVSDMPAGTSGKQADQEKTTTVSLQGDEIRVDDRVVSMQELQGFLRGQHLDQKVGDAKIIILTANGKVKYQTYYATMAAIQDSGGIVAIVSDDAREKE